MEKYHQLLISAVIAARLLSPSVALGQLRQKAPAPVWRTGIESDPRYAQQHAFLSEDGTQIIVRYQPEPEGGSENPEVVLFAKIRNRLAPRVKVQVSESNGQYAYRYEVANRRTARDRIAFWQLTAPVGIETSPTPRGRWAGPTSCTGPPARRLALAPANLPGCSFAWFPNDFTGGKPIPPGGSESGFAIDSPYRPGFTVATLSDNATAVVDWPTTDGVWPDIVTRQLDPLLRWVFERNKVVTIGPVFRPNADAGTIAADLKFALDQLAGANEIDPQSRFVKEAQMLLDGIAAGTLQGKPALRVQPSTDREEQLATILRLSLQVATAP